MDFNFIKLNHNILIINNPLLDSEGVFGVTVIYCMTKS